MSAKPGDEEWAKVVATIGQSQELFRAFREGAKLDHLGLTLHSDLSRYSKEDFSALFPRRDYNDTKANRDASSFGLAGYSDEADKLLCESTVGILLPHFSAFHSMARALIVDSRLAATQSDSDRIITNIDTTFGIARQLYNEPFLVASFISKAIFEIGVMHIEELTTDNPELFSPDQLKHLQQSIAKFEIPTQWDFAADRDVTQDMLQRIYSDDGNGDGRLTSVGLEILTVMKIWTNEADANDPQRSSVPWQQQTPAARTFFGPALMLTSPTRKEANDSIERYFNIAEESFTANYWEEDYADMEASADENVDDELSGIYPTFHRVRNSLNSALATKNAGLIAVAAIRFRNANEAWPQTLDDLVGEYLDEKPVDPVTGKPLKFKMADDAIVVYSVGIDLDDDEGTNNSLSNPFMFKRPKKTTFRSGRW